MAGAYTWYAVDAELSSAGIVGRSMTLDRSTTTLVWYHLWNSLWVSATLPAQAFIFYSNVWNGSALWELHHVKYCNLPSVFQETTFSQSPHGLGESGFKRACHHRLFRSPRYKSKLKKLVKGFIQSITVSLQIILSLIRYKNALTYSIPLILLSFIFHTINPSVEGVMEVAPWWTGRLCRRSGGN